MEGKSTTQKQKRLATLVGCNYAGTPHELRGCINDVVAMRELLVARFGFAHGDVTVLTDDDGAAHSAVLPTGANIKRVLAEMAARAAPGDVLFFHYSGHGTLVPRRHHRGAHGHGREEAEEEEDEAIVPCDFNLVTDDDFRELVDRVPRGATFTMVSDSCHSGGLIDNEKEQIGPDVVDLLGGAAARATTTRARFIPYGAVVDHLSGASGVDASHHVGDHLVALFGTDASAKFRRHDHDSARPRGQRRRRPDEGILLSGCQSDETSADVAAEEEGGSNNKACGAFSSAVQAVLAAHPAPMSNRELVTGARAVLREQGFEQHPCLYCSDDNADKPFLHQSQEEEEERAAVPVAEL